MGAIKIKKFNFLHGLEVNNIACGWIWIFCLILSLENYTHVELSFLIGVGGMGFQGSLSHVSNVIITWPLKKEPQFSI